jgi:hypothetical protein
MNTTTQEQDMTTTLTTNEIAFLKQVINYDDREGQKSDNISNAGMQEAVALMGGKHNGAGLLGSLTAKMIGEMHCDGYDVFEIYHDMIDTVYDAIENHEEVAA